MLNSEYIREELEKVPNEKRASRADELAAFYGVSRQTVWRKANEAGLRIRAEKSNKGETSVSDELLELVAARILISKRLNKQFTNPIKKAYYDLIDEGINIPVGYQRICVLLKERNLDKESLSIPTPHVQLVSLHPNHVHQFDVSNCLQWHFKNKGSLTERDIERTLYKNKIVKEAKKIKQELLRYVLVDHCSGAFFMWYYYTSGERPEDGADFFYRAWTEKAELIENTIGLADYNGAYQLQGVPQILVSDKGSILTSKIMKNLMAGLGVKIELHQAGNPRAKGMVEGLMKIIGYDFESNLRRYNISNLEDLNRFALDWCIERNCEMKFRNFEPRARLWLKIKPEELRLCPDEIIFKKLQHKPQETRKCDGNCIVSYEGRKYQCPDVNSAHRKVIVQINAYEYPAMDIHFNGNVYKVMPQDVDEYGRTISTDAVPYGEYKSKPNTDIQKAKTKLEQIAQEEWGVGFKGDKQKRRAVQPTTDIKPDIKVEQSNVVFMKKRGLEINTPDIHAPLTEEKFTYLSGYKKREPRETVLSQSELITQEGVAGEWFPQRYARLTPISEMIRMYMAEYGKLTKEQNGKLKKLYPGGVPSELTLTDVYNALNQIQEVKDAENRAG